MVTIQSINLRAQSWFRARNTGWCQHANLWALGGSQEWCKSQAADSVWKFSFLIVPPGSLRQTAAWLESPSGTHPSLPLWRSAFFRGFSRLFYVHVKEAFYCEVVGSHKTAAAVFAIMEARWCVIFEMLSLSLVKCLLLDVASSCLWVHTAKKKKCSICSDECAYKLCLSVCIAYLRNRIKLSLLPPVGWLPVVPVLSPTPGWF